LADKPAIEDGWLAMPGKAGLGVDLATDVQDCFPYIEGHYAIQVKR
jgi:hypothetical protein